MKINPKYNGTIIGAIFTVSCILLTLTLIVPIISFLPILLFSQFLAYFIENDIPSIENTILIVLIVILTVSLFLFLNKARKTGLSESEIIGIMVFEFFVIHALGFYIFLATLDDKTDGQLFFGIIDSFPQSSFGFMIIGIMIDLIKRKSNKLISIPSQGAT